jgi:hypothetical protein
VVKLCGEWLQRSLEVDVDPVHHALPEPRGRRLPVRLCLLAFCGGLLLLLSSRPAEAAERREARLLDPVGATLKATAREVDSLAGRAAGSGSSTVGKAADAVRRTVAPQPRPTARAARSTAAADTSPVRRVASPTHPVTKASRAATRSLTSAATPATEAAAGPVGQAATITTGPVGRVAEAGGRVLAPVGSVLAPVGSVFAPVTGPVGGLVGAVLPGGLAPLALPIGLPGLLGPGAVAPAGPVARLTGLEGTGSAGLVPSAISQTTPARLAADGAGSPAARPDRSWPALTGAVSLPGVPASAELPAGGPDPLSTSSGAAFGVAALAAALLLLGPLGRGRTRLERSGILSRSYLPLVSPA